MQPVSEPTFRHAPRVATGYQAVADHLMREIALGTIVAGEKLPPERVLAEQLGVARETLRQAIRVLEGSGQVEVRRGALGGTFVLARESSKEAALASLRARSQEMQHNLEFRGIVESKAASLAAERRSSSVVDEMHRLQHLLLKAASLDEARRIDTAFHALIARATNNPMIEQAVEDARVFMFSATDQTLFEFQTHTSHAGHAAVLDAIQARDSMAAGAAMEQHIATTARELQLLLQE